MKLYIIGNGFDCHNLFKTDFGKYKVYLENSYASDSMYYGIVKLSEKYLYTSFHNSDNWSDIENNLTFDYKKYFKDYCDCFNKPREIPGEPLPFVDELILNQFWERNFSDVLMSFTGECYFEWLESTYNKRLKDNIQNPEDTAFLIGNRSDLFINFNYTPTLQDIYKIPENNILYIHGKLSDVDKGNLRINHGLKNGSKVTELRSSLARVIQFGSINNSPKKIREELENIKVIPQNREFDINKLLDNIEYVCSFTYKDIQSNYKKMVAFIKDRPITDVVIMGHSFSGIDDPYYNDILVPKFKKSQWTFYCYSKNAVNQDEINAKEFTNRYNINLSENPFPKWR